MNETQSKVCKNQFRQGECKYVNTDHISEILLGIVKYTVFHFIDKSKFP